jgi:hypothetical protein
VKSGSIAAAGETLTYTSTHTSWIRGSVTHLHSRPGHPAIRLERNISDPRSLFSTQATHHRHRITTGQTIQRTPQPTPFIPFTFFFWGFQCRVAVWCFRCVKLCTTLPLMILASPRLASPLPVELSSRLTLILSGITLTALPSPG